MSEITYYYAAYSGFAYLGSRRFQEIAKQAQRTIVHKPIDLEVVLSENGSQSWADRTKAHLDYYFRRELERWSEYRQVSVLKQRPTYHGNSTNPANKLLIAAIVSGLNVNQLSHQLMTKHWVEDADLADKDTLIVITESAGFNAQELMDLADSSEVDVIYRQNTQDALDLSVFGSPTYIVDGDMFYGQDHLELVERALNSPFLNRLSL
ncbi:MAG: 2-hydroxychromene-2-carboxylate isomerase [Betaproteobacteria bacterium]|jgi:2-hydroxychromene-2-carboxylate isomerase|nr:2-hydroxychromene-2-carboxylate isomerase [Pseudomonadota bacterium]MBT4386403.1 2-hydroxychromene-2-carboxylate isomerase [Betaproteobacteria bacterium]MDB4826084.1 2-hydroxychromene-2-carboxylate isomerase [Gammaproteobacteria bacterium]MBT4107207.1 2-hydroxychromene-2-carboxylate isomerase [Pseudomonadota bacterium]MBT4986482.1 2-hydroxychromene-2-carboxylate isomerase [Pseudomonadota bacterium]